MEVVVLLAYRMAAASLVSAANFEKPLGVASKPLSAEPRPAEFGPQQELARSEGALPPQVDAAQRVELTLGLEEVARDLDREEAPRPFEAEWSLGNSSWET
jgi:hypothetical protein